MASLNQFIQPGSGAPTAFQQVAQTPQYRLNETGPALAADAGIAQYRNDANFSMRTTPQMQNQAAAQGNFGSTGASTQYKWAQQDASNTDADITRMLARNTANIGQQKVLAAMGSYL